MEENRVRDIYELERIALRVAEKIMNDEAPPHEDFTDEESAMLLERICDLIKKDLKEADLKLWMPRVCDLMRKDLEEDDLK